MTKVDDDKKEILKKIIRDIHKGKDVKVLQQRFAEVIKDISPTELSSLEQTLIDEGLPESEIKRLCDLHVAVFKQSLDKQRKPETIPGHPVHSFMMENREIEKIFKKVNEIITKLRSSPDNAMFKNVKPDFEKFITRLSEIYKHYLRKENQLFPLLESHNVSGPTQVMWGIHDDIRDKIKKLKKQISQDKSSEFLSTFEDLEHMIKDMIYKEEHILFPMSLETLSHDDWLKVKEGESEIGYAWIKPGEEWSGKQVEVKKIKTETDKLPLNTGSLSLNQINLMLTHLPVDISFVNDKDEVAYYSDTPERIFPRSAGVIGRKVQKCHPPKSVHVVEKILKEFKKGKKDVAEFWIQLGGKFIHIRYFAVRDKNGEYQGTLEVSQDITDIKKLEGQRRLLDWG
jgi:hypothetical protein